MSYRLTLFGCLILGCALPVVAEPLAVKKVKPAGAPQVTRRGNVTEIVIHNPKPTAKADRAPERAANTPAPSLSAVNFQEVNVQAPAMAPARVNPRNSNPTAGVTWSQNWEPGPTAQMSANRGGTFGISIVPTYPIYPYWNQFNSYGPVYRPGYFGPLYQSGVNFSGPGYSSSLYTTNYSSFGVGATSIFVGGGRGNCWYR